MNDPDSAKNAVRFAWLNRSMNLCIYSLLDVGIHYHGWTPAQAARFLKLFGIRDAAVTAEIYRYITETPANYLKYYVGYLNFLDLKEEQQSLLGENFDLKSFHQKIHEREIVIASEAAVFSPGFCLPDPRAILPENSRNAVTFF